MSNLFAEYAAKYAERGYHVFPCASRGKTPLTKKGFQDATTDPEQIAEWSEQFPDANIGIATGASNLVVLDVDVKSGGIESLKDLYQDERIAEALKKTRRIRTGTGGYHFYFRPHAGAEVRNSASKLGSGLDIRAAGGYVIAPPSVNAEGNLYNIENRADPIELPLALVSKLEVGKWTPVRKAQNPVGKGGRNDYLMRIGCSMRAKYGFDQEALFGSLMSVNQVDCSPPLPEAEVRQIAGSVARYEPGEAEKVKLRLKSGERGDGTRRGKKRLDLVTYDQIQEEDLNWIWYGRIAEGKFGLLVGLPGKTKSYLTAYIIARVTQGEPLPDDYVNTFVEPKSVLLLTYEDGQGDTIKKRLSKCGADMSKVFTIPVESENFTKDDWDALEVVLQEHPEIKLVVIDPIQAIMNGEDDNKESVVRPALSPAVTLGAKYKCAFLGVKHLNKDESKSIDSRVGGSIAYTGLARTILFAGHDNEKPFGENREVYAGCIVTKGNIAGAVSPISYEVNDRGLFMLGTDPELTVERLLPRPPDRKRKD